ncbi:MAG: PVC-type heme-binding CxxCH protein [Verrucomicrobiales bacterium]
MREFPVRRFFRLTLCLLWASGATLGIGAEQTPAAAASRPAATGPSELELAVKKLRPAAGMKVDLFAAEPALQNPVSFAFDEQGRAYVVETHRRRTSVFDIRNHPDWLDDDFSFRTVLDRSNFFRKVLIPGNTNLPPRIVSDRNGDGKFDSADLEVESERIRLLTDQNGDGVVDKATTFAENFKTVVSGVAAGILARKGDVYFTCIPDLWKLRDANGDGVAESRQQLSTGYGVHISFGGHDLHGLKIGPDGKLYFSIADRGLHVQTEGKTIANPDSGAVLRCNLDGSNLELFATGLRNPQELAFDQFGNLWTGDNNGDGGDKARWVHLVEGSDSGWHIGWQHLPKMGAWNSEGLWELAPTNTGSYLIPPVAHIGHGPAGLAFYPGTGMPAQYANHFFMADFPGGIRTFALQPKGFSYQVVNLQQFLWELYPVDIDFAPNGGAYVLDWVQGWEKTGKGRIFRVYEPASVNQPIVAETKRLLAEGMDQRPIEDLGRLLAHIDMRVRQEAQFALAARGAAATNLLVQTALQVNTPELARLHAIWGIGQVANEHPLALGPLINLLADPISGEVRAQSARVIGDMRLGLAYEALLKSLRDPNPRVRFYAALALGKIGIGEAGPAILQMLSENADVDPFLRHAGVMALTWMNDMNILETASRDNASSVRMATALAMRRLNRPEVAMFLYDSKPQIVLEAARAVYESNHPNGLSQLASMVSKTKLEEPVFRRAIHANYRIGKLENAMALSEMAVNNSLPIDLRVEIIELLGQWANPPRRDLLTGLYRPLPARENRSASLALRSELPALLQSGSDAIRVAAIHAAVGLEISQAASHLMFMVQGSNNVSVVRVEALKALHALKDPQWKEAWRIAADDPDENLRKTAIAIQPKTSSGSAATALLATLEKGSIAEKRAALEQLAGNNDIAVDAALLVWIDNIAANKAPREIELELLEAAAKRKDPLIQAQLARFHARRATNDLALRHREVLFGGNVANGRKIFFERADASCLRCHKIKGEGGDVGPALDGIGGRYPREYLLESIIEPSNRIAPGFENLVIRMKDGTVYSGLLKADELEIMTINSPEEGIIKIPKADIESLDLGLSAMPAEITSTLSKRDLRDLVEFLSSLR